MNYHPQMPLSLKLEPRSRRCPRNRYSGPAVATMRSHRRACLIFILLWTVGPVFLVAVTRYLASY